MPPGATTLGNNRFALLSSSAQPKRKKANKIKEQIFPALPAIPKENPKYLVVSSTEENKPLNKFSCFAVHKALLNISSEIQKISELRDGNLLVLVKNINTANKFIATKKLLGVCNVKIDLHNNLNSSKGTIYAPCLNEIPEQEIIENLKEQGVVSVYKFPKNVNGKTVSSGVVLLTFDRFHLPEKIDISWYTTKVRAYYPNPMRCKNCQLLGHTKKRCNKPPVCDKCALPPHDPTTCTRTLCVNCSGDHPASSKSCPKFTQMKKIITIQTDNKCSFREALNIHKMQIPSSFDPSSTTFANILSNQTIQDTNNKNINININRNNSNENNTTQTTTPKTLPTLNITLNDTNKETKENETSPLNINNSINDQTTTMTVDDSPTMSFDHSSTFPIISNFISHLNNSSTFLPTLPLDKSITE